MKICTCGDIDRPCVSHPALKWSDGTSSRPSCMPNGEGGWACTYGCTDPSHDTRPAKVLIPDATLAKAYRMVADDLPGPTAPALLRQRADELEAADKRRRVNIRLGAEILNNITNADYFDNATCRPPSEDDLARLGAYTRSRVEALTELRFHRS